MFAHNDQYRQCLDGLPIWQLASSLAQRKDDQVQHGQLSRQEGCTALQVVSLMIPRFTPGAFCLQPEPELWRSDFAHLALHQLGAATNISASDAFLYHMVNISLHIDLHLLQCFARPGGGASTEAVRKSMAADFANWSQGRHGAIARWHATRIVLQAQSSLSKKANAKDEPQGHISPSPKSHASMLGAPHVPYSIYYATIVLWGAATVTGSSQMERELLLRTGSHVLCSLAVRVASVLASALSEIQV